MLNEQDINRNEYWDARMLLGELKHLLKVKSFDDIVPAIQKLQERIENLKNSIKEVS